MKTTPYVWGAGGFQSQEAVSWRVPPSPAFSKFAGATLFTNEGNPQVLRAVDMIWSGDWLLVGSMQHTAPVEQDRQILDAGRSGDGERERARHHVA